MQSLLTIFVESSLGDKRQDTQTAVKFLDDQIKRYEQNLQAAENRIKDFKLKYMGVAAEPGPGLLRTRRDAGNRRSRQRALELQSAEQARDSYKKRAGRRRRRSSCRRPTDAADARGVARSRRAHRRAEARPRHAAAQIHRRSIPTSSHAAADRAARGAAHAELEARRKARRSGQPQASTPSIRTRCSSRCSISLADAEATVASAARQARRLRGAARSR